MYSPVGSDHCCVMGATQVQFVGMPPTFPFSHSRCLNEASWFECLLYRVRHLHLLSGVEVRGLIGSLSGVWTRSIRFGIGYSYTSDWARRSICSVGTAVRSALRRLVVSTSVAFITKRTFFRRCLSPLFLQLARDFFVIAPVFRSSSLFSLLFFGSSFVFSSPFFFVLTRVWSF